MSRFSRVGLALLGLILFAAVSGCHPRDRATHVETNPHIVAPIKPVVKDLDRQLGKATGLGIAASALSAAGVVFVMIEAATFLRLALAIAASCMGMTVALFCLRLAVPILAALMPWFVAGAVIAALVAAVLWYKHAAPVRCKLFEKPVAP